MMWGRNPLLFSFIWAISCPSTMYWKIYPFFSSLIYNFVINQDFIHRWICFWILYAFHWPICTHWLNCCSFILSHKIREEKHFVLQECLCKFWTTPLPRKFRIVTLNITKITITTAIMIIIMVMLKPPNSVRNLFYMYWEN